MSTQGELFDTAPGLPAGLHYREAFLDETGEAALLDEIRALDLRPARYKAYVAHRRTMSFGWSYDYDTNALNVAPPLPGFLLPLRARVAAWIDVPPEDFVHALVTAYAPGTAIGWHRDAMNFERVAGVSLLGSCRLLLRPYPHVPRRGARPLELHLAPRSAYVLTGAARWDWQHHVPPTPGARYSITFRTLSATKNGAKRRQARPATI